MEARWRTGTRLWVAVGVLVMAICIVGCLHGSRTRAVVMFYNCENLFDTALAPSHCDSEFTPTGSYRHTAAKYAERLHRTAMVIAGIGQEYGSLPAIVGLVEVENAGVLNALAQCPELARTGYRAYCTSGPDTRGINVGLLYDTSAFSMLQVREIRIPIPADAGTRPTRNILKVRGILLGDTVVCYIAHFPSRKGKDTAVSNRRRLAAASALRDDLERQVCSTPNTKLLIMGDFNGNSEDPSGDDDMLPQGCRAFCDTFAGLQLRNQGSFSFRGKTYMFDRIIVSRSLANQGSAELQLARAGVYKRRFLATKQDTDRPNGAYLGTLLTHGFSDHFPVVVELQR